MGASNSTSQNTKYFKLKEDKTSGSPTFGRYTFEEIGKENGEWKTIAQFTTMTGFLKELNVKQYTTKEGPKESLTISLKDDASDQMISIQTGFESSVAKGILNSILGTLDDLKLLSFECGYAKEYNGKFYPTLYIKNGGERTEWAYSKEKGNLDVMPSIKYVEDEDGNKLKKGVKMYGEFWKAKIEGMNNFLKNTFQPKEITNDTMEKVSSVTENDFLEDDDLPF